MTVYELVLTGFAGGTDETDNKIIWIRVPNDMVIELAEDSNAIESISKIPVNDGIDLTVRMRWFVNYYHCPECNCKWQDEWDCMCNDRCPKCNAEIEPYKSRHL